MNALHKESTRIQRLNQRRSKSVGIAITLVVTLVATLWAVPLLASSNANPAPVVPVSSGTAGTVTSREEVVYATLSPTGQVQAAFAVTALEVSSPGTIVDYGNFSSAINLTTTEPLTYDDGTVSVQAPTGRFFYQGAMTDLRLPWDIAIHYYLAGERVLPAELAGKDGAVRIEITTTPGTAAGQEYFDNYVLQISLTLDTRHFSNISAAGSTMANAGRNKIVTFTVMPGNTGHATINAETTSFTLSPIEIAALPLSIKIDNPDTSALTDELTPLTEGVAALHQGMGRLKDGVAELSQGAAGLSTGADQFGQGLGQLDASSPELMAGSEQIRQALNAVAAALEGQSGEFSLGSMLQLTPALAQLSAGLNDISAALEELDQAFTLAYAALEQSISGIPTDEISQAQLGALYAANPERAALLDSLVQYYTAARVVQGTFQAVQPAFAATGMSLGPIAASIDTISATLADMSAALGMAMQDDASAAMLPQLIQGISALAQQYQGFHAGLAQYTQGLTQLTHAFAPLSAGVSGLAQGSTELQSGANQMHSATRQLRDGLKDIPGRITEEIEQMIQSFDKSDFVPGSFLSSRNEKTTAVQFVMRTQGIAMVAPEQEAEPAPSPLTLWERLASLFRP
jgi:X-X-X-Leu-X-X-Gly heptad repeat protein